MNCNEIYCKNYCLYFRFPKDEIRRNDWLKGIHRETWVPSKYAVVCSEHFTEDSFDLSGNEIKLRLHAVPAITMQVNISNNLGDKNLRNYNKHRYFWVLRIFILVYVPTMRNTDF